MRTERYASDDGCMEIRIFGKKGVFEIFDYFMCKISENQVKITKDVARSASGAALGSFRYKFARSFQI